MNLETLGWNNYNKELDLSVLSLARITAIHRSHLEAETATKKINLHPSSAFSEVIAVGDWVRHSPEFIDEQGKSAAVITELLERKSYLSRNTEKGEQFFASNLDCVFIVTSANQDFNIKRLQRYVVLAKNGLCKPIIILSKADLCDSLEFYTQQIEESLEVEYLITSSTLGKGIEDLREYLPVGSTSVFVGSSGVGKSSLVNRLLGEEIQSIKSIREDDGKGKHTTTSRQMFLVPQGGLIVDTPGIREVQVLGDSETLEESFPLIQKISAKCKFRDCSHQKEPGCAIVKALEEGELQESAWQNYEKLNKEIAFQKRKDSPAEKANAKKRWKSINVSMKKKRKWDEKK